MVHEDGELTHTCVGHIMVDFSVHEHLDECGIVDQAVPEKPIRLQILPPRLLRAWSQRCE